MNKKIIAVMAIMIIILSASRISYSYFAASVVEPIPMSEFVTISTCSGICLSFSDLIPISESTFGAGGVSFGRMMAVIEQFFIKDNIKKVCIICGNATIPQTTGNQDLDALVAVCNSGPYPMCAAIVDFLLPAILALGVVFSAVYVGLNARKAYPLVVLALLMIGYIGALPGWMFLIVLIFISLQITVTLARFIL